MSNYPPGESGARQETSLDMSCSQGHKWIVGAYWELGAFFLDDLEFALYCPVCGNPDTDAVGEADPPHLDPDGFIDNYTIRQGVYVANSVFEYEKAMEQLDKEMPEEPVDTRPHGEEQSRVDWMERDR